MDTTKGSSQYDLTAAKTNTSTTNRMYMTRFLSDSLNVASISANTWTFNISCWSSSSATYYPTETTFNYRIPSCLYVYRPSDGTVVGNVFDGMSASDTYAYGYSMQVCQVTTYTGSAVASVSPGDILVFEAWTSGSVSTSLTYHYAFDGATITTTDGSTVSNHASFLETPQTITFGVPAITATSTGKVNTNKIIVKG